MAADSLRVEIITRDFGRMLDELAGLDPTVEFKDVVDGAAARVAQGALNRTVAAKAGAIRARHEAKEWTTFNGRKVRIGGDEPWHFPDATWQAISQFRAIHLQVKLHARGLAKQAWLGFAAQLGRALTTPSYVLAANYRGRTHGDNSFAEPQSTGHDYNVTLHQLSPLIEGGRMERALLGAMVGETRYFYVNMEQRAFRTFASRAAKYPGIFTTPGLTGLSGFN